MGTMSTGAAPMSAVPDHVPEQPRSLLRYLPYTDRLAVFGWVILTSFPSEWAAPIRYLLVAYFAGCTLLCARQTLPTLVRGWPAFILATLALVSTIWAPSADEAIRKAVFMALAATIAIYTASRLSSRHIIMAYFFGELVGGVLSILNPSVGGGGAWAGVFGQKNFLAVHMFILYISALVLLLDSKSELWLRLLTFFGAILAASLIVLSLSATTTLLMGASTVALVLHAFVWQPAVRVRHMRTVIAFVIVLLATTVGLLVFGLLQLDAWDAVLQAFGKDSTLTGRTFVWEIGERVMAEHPLTGVGANGFWRPELGAAREITRHFNYEGFTKFSFHNSYLENGVQFGYPGYYATYFLAGWGLFCAAMIWLRNQTLMNAAFLTFSVMVVIRSTAEIDFAAELGATIILFYISALRGKQAPPDYPAKVRRTPPPHMQPSMRAAR
jgi:exopolysaccharide production protein ExoQ